MNSVDLFMFDSPRILDLVLSVLFKQTEMI